MPNNAPATLSPSALFPEQSELSCIAGCVRDESWLQQALSTLTPDDFGGDLTRPLFQALLEAGDASNLPAIADRAAELGGIASPGDYSSLLVRCLSDKFYCTDDIEGTIALIRDKAACRRLQDFLAQQAPSMLIESPDVSAATDRLIGKIEQFVPNAIGGKTLSPEELFPRSFERLAELSLGTVNPSTGFPDLDSPEAMNGFQPGDLVILGACPSMGKTRLARMFTLAAIRQFIPVKFYSLEVSAERLFEALIAADQEIPALNLKRPTARDLERFLEGQNREYFQGNLLSICDRPTGDEVLRDVPRWAKRNPGGVIFIDYLQLMTDSGEGGSIGESVSGQERQKIDFIVGRLASLAKTHGVTIVLLSQLSRGVEARQNKRPLMSDLKESGKIEAAADIILMLYRDEYYNPDTTERCVTEVLIRKNRNGSSGLCVKLLEDRELQTLKSMVRRYESAY